MFLWFAGQHLRADFRRLSGREIIAITMHRVDLTSCRCVDLLAVENGLTRWIERKKLLR